jgi:hypothetical protein
VTMPLPVSSLFSLREKRERERSSIDQRSIARVEGRPSINRDNQRI